MAWKDGLNGLLNKISGNKADYADDYDDGYDYVDTDEVDDGGRHVPAAAPVQQTKAYRMIIVEPYSFEDAGKVADHLLQYRPVLINMEKTEEEISRRLIDFVDGVVYAQHGSLEQVNENIYLAVPNNMSVDKVNYTYTKPTTDFSGDLPQWQDRP